MLHPVDLIHRLPGLDASIVIGEVTVSVGQFVVLVGTTLLVRALGAAGDWWVRRRAPADQEKEPVARRLVRATLRIGSWGLGAAAGIAVARIVTLEALLTGMWRLFNAPLISIADTSISVSTLLAVLGVIAASYWVSGFLRERIQEGAAEHLTDEDRKSRFAIIERLLHYLIVLTGVGIALHTAGINLSGLFAAGAVFAVGIGFAMQNIAQNFVSGVIVLVERAIKPGDILIVENRVVQVKRMGIRSTVVRTRDDEDLIVPNGTLAQSTVANLTLLDRTHRIRVPVGVAYESDVDAVFATLERVAKAFEDRDVREPVVLMRAFGSSSLDFEVSVWTTTPWREPSIASALHRAIWRGLKDDAITIAFPQLDVHLDEDIVRAVGGKR